MNNKLYVVYNREADKTYSSFIVRCNNKKEAVNKVWERCDYDFPKKSFDAHLLEDCFKDEETDYGWKDVFMIT